MGRQVGASTVRGHDQRGQRDGPVVVAVVEQLGVRDAGVRFRHVGHVLTGGDEQRREPVRVVGAVVGVATDERPRVGDLAGPEQLVTLHAHQALEDVVLDHGLGDDALAPGQQHVDAECFLSVSTLPDSMYSSGSGRLDPRAPASVALPVMFWPAASPVV